MTSTFPLCGCNLNSSHCQMYSQSHRGGKRSQRESSGTDIGVYPPTLPGQFSRHFTLSCTYNSTDLSSFYHSIKSSGAATECFQTALFSAQGFLKGSCDEVFCSDIIKHPKATEGIKRMSRKPFHYWKVGFYYSQGHCPQMPLELLLMCQQREQFSS